MPPLFSDDIILSVENSKEQVDKRNFKRPIRGVDKTKQKDWSYNNINILNAERKKYI